MAREIKKYFVFLDHSNVQHGWPNVLSDDMLIFKRKQEEIYIDKGCLMWGHGVIIPYTLRKQLLNELHSAHLGICKMKSLARAYMWWPNIDLELKRLVKACDLCLSNADSLPKSKLHVWDWPKGPNVRIHMDFCGPIQGRMYFVIVDAYSKWMDVMEIRNITAP